MSNHSIKLCHLLQKKAGIDFLLAARLQFLFTISIIQITIMSSQGRTPTNSQLQSQVSVYLRSSQKRAHLVKVSREVEYQQILRTISEKIKAPSQRLVLFFKGEQLSSEERVTLTDKSIIHYVNLDHVQKTIIINLSIKKLEGDKMAARFQVESKGNIKEFIDGRMQQVFKQNSEQVFLVYTGKQLDVSKTFQQEFVEDQSEILCVNMDDSEFLVPEASIISHRSRQMPQKTNPDIQLRPGRSYMENFHKKPESQNGSIRSNAGAVNQYKNVNIPKEVSNQSKQEDGEIISIAPVPVNAKEETAQPSLHSAPTRNLQSTESNERRDVSTRQVNEPTRNLADEGYSLIQQIKRKLNEKTNIESEQAIPERQQQQKDKQSSQLLRNVPSRLDADTQAEPQASVREITPAQLQQPANLEEQTEQIKHLEEKKQGDEEKLDLVKCFFFENKPESPLSKILQKYEIDNTPVKIECEESIEHEEKQPKIQSFPPEIEHHQELQQHVNENKGIQQEEIIEQNINSKRQFTEHMEENKRSSKVDSQQPIQNEAPVDLQVFTLHSAKSYAQKYNIHVENTYIPDKHVHEENQQAKEKSQIHEEKKKVEEHVPLQPSLLQIHQQGKNQSPASHLQTQQIATEFNSADSLPSASDELPRSENHEREGLKQPQEQKPKTDSKGQEKILIVSAEEENLLDEPQADNASPTLKEAPAQENLMEQTVPQEILTQRQQPKETHQIKQAEHHESEMKELNSEGPTQRKESFNTPQPISQEKPAVKVKEDEDLLHQPHQEEDYLLDEPTIKLNNANYNHESPEPEQQTLQIAQNDSLSEKSFSQPIYPQSEQSKTPVNERQSDLSQQDPSQDEKPRSNAVSNKSKEQNLLEQHQISANNSRISQKLPSHHEDHEQQRQQNAMTHMAVKLNKDADNQSQESQESFQKVTVPLQDRIDFKAGDLIYSGELNINETENMMGHILSDYSHLINKNQGHSNIQLQDK